jgi:hypothetical protein
MTWFCAYDVAMSLQSSSHHLYMFINHHVILGAYIKFIGCITCNRCAEDRVMSEVPLGVEPKVGVRSGAGGPVRRSRRRRGNRS